MSAEPAIDAYRDHAIYYDRIGSYEGEHFLIRAGFAVRQLCADYECRPFFGKYPSEMIFVAEKIAET